MSAERGIISPLKFITIAEDIGFINELGYQIIKTAMGEFRHFSQRASLKDDFLLHINVSPWQLNEPHFHERFTTIMKENGLTEGEITNVAVTRKMRKKGCGRELLLRMQQWADEHGIDRIILEVRSGNEPAIHLYRTCGFEKIGVRKNFYQFPREDADIMEWKRLC